MTDNILIDKSIDFGARIVRLYRYLVKTQHEAVLSKQILRSGTSVGASINETQYGNSKADFIAKLHIALKETAETEYWLHILQKLEYWDKEDYYFPNRRPEDAYTAPQSREDVSADLHFIRLRTWVDQFHFAVRRSRTISLYTSRVRFHPFNQGKYSYRLKRANAPDVKSVINRSLFKAGLVV